MSTHDFPSWDSPSENDDKFWNIPTSTIFLVDATRQMQQHDYLQICFKSFENVVRQKCTDNKRDKMGLILFGTKDSNCQVDNVTVLQEYSTVSVNTLQTIKDIVKNGVSKYQPIAADSNYPLFNALSYASEVLNSSKTSAKASKTILLCTCIDKPHFDDPSENRRIEHLVATFKSTQTKLLVAGLSDSWNDNIYYKDLQIISGTCTNNNYKQFHLKELEETILRPSKTVIKVQWKISSSISVPVSISCIISSTPKYPSKIKVNKKDNELLETRCILQEQCIDDFFETPNEESQKQKRKVIPRENIKHYKIYGGQKITFSPSEFKQLKLLNSEPGIEILAFKPVECNPSYHIKSAYFVTCTETCNTETKSFFMAFVNKCAKKKVMAVCKIITNLIKFIGTMIPSEDDGGFYLHRMPLLGAVRDLDNRFYDYIFNSDNECPLHKNAVSAFKQLIQLSAVKFDPQLFKNPKLEKIAAHLEALAFDEELKPLPPDSTLPPPIKDDVKVLTDALIIMLDLKEKRTRKRRQATTADIIKKRKLDMKAIIESKMLHTLTVPQLKEYLQDLNLPLQGNKKALIERIYNYHDQ